MTGPRGRVHLAVAEGGVLVRPTRTTDNRLGVELRACTNGMIRRRQGGYLVPFHAASRLGRIPVDLEWDLDARRAVENRARVAANHSSVLDEVRRVQERGPTKARSSLRIHGWVARLDDHQVVNVAALTASGGWGGCVFDEQGTGKTPTMIATFDVLHARDEADILLVVAPKTMLGEWKTEFDHFTGGLYRVGVADGPRAVRAAVLEAGNDVIVVNYETVVSLLENLKVIAKRARVVLAVDESFFVKNKKTARAAAMMELREWCVRAYVLCGTPAPNSPHDLVAQFDLVDFGVTFSGVRLDDDRKIATDQVRAAIDERGFFTRNVKQVVLPHLPGRRFSEVRVNLAPTQLRAYSSALNDLVIDLRTVTDEEFGRKIASFMERRAALLRICSDPTPLVPGYSELPAKIAALDALLDDLVTTRGEKVVVWSFYRYSLDRIAARYAHLGLVRIDGSVTDVTQRRSAVRRFQSDNDTRVFLGNPAAAGAGLTLHSARIAIYESLSNQAAHYLQSLDRIHRRGQEREVEYLTLLCQGTIEEAEYSRLLEKADRQADLLGDRLDPRPVRTVMLDELMAAQSQLAK